MAGKNTAAFGIYQTQADVEYAVAYCGPMAFAILTSPFCSPKTKAPKTSRWKRAPKHRKERLPESRPER
jgi:hypothetical protein